MSHLEQNDAPNNSGTYVVSAASRLHFGLLEICENQPNQFGGLGLMIEEPRVEIKGVRGACSVKDLQIKSIPYWQDRIRAICQHWMQTCQSDGLPLRELNCQRAIAPHVGLGSGTQVSCAVTKLLEKQVGRDVSDIEALAKLSQRGLRSYVGLAGFLHGGLIVDYGQNSNRLSRVVRCEFSQDWPLLLIRALGVSGDSGEKERRMFEECSKSPNPLRENMLHLIEDQIVPSLRARDWQTWDKSIGDYGRMAGRIFESAQGGLYRFPVISKVVDALIKLGCWGAAQSSWGPTVVLATADQAHAQWITNKLSSQFPEITIDQTSASNRPATWGSL